MTDDSLLGQLADEFTRGAREGKLPDVEEYARRYPELADRIHQLFPTLMLLEGMAAIGDSEETEAMQSPLSAGEVFGSYRIEREIGRGGMGIVYEALHVLLEKKVALKVLPVRTLFSAEHLERFFREARTAACLHHTNIVPVFDVGQVSGTPYFAMRLPGNIFRPFLKATADKRQAQYDTKHTKSIHLQPSLYRSILLSSSNTRLLLHLLYWTLL
jgi:eukaryotic-like serine/threonine-protein kinase